MEKDIKKIDEDEIDLWRMIGTLHRYRWTIIFFALLGVLISGIIAYFKPNIYETSSTVEIQVKNPWGFGRQSEINSALMGETASSLDTEMEIIKSRFVTAKALESVDFSHRYYYYKYLKEHELYKDSPFTVEMTKGYGISFDLYPLDKDRFRLEATYKDERKREKKYNKIHRYGREIHTKDFVMVVNRVSAIEMKNDKYRFEVVDPVRLPEIIRKRVSAHPVSKNATLIEISFQDTVALRDQEFVNALTRAYMRQNIERRTQEAKKTLEFIDSQIKTLAENLKVSAANLEDFQRRTKTIDVDKKVERLSEKLGEYESQLATLKLQKDVLNSLVQKVKEGKNLETLTLAGIGVEDQSLIAVVADLRNTILKEKELLRDYTSAYPEVKKLKTRVEQLKKIIMDSVANLYRSVNEKEKFLQKQMDRFRLELASLPEDQRNFLALQRRFASNEKFYSYLMEKRTETEIRKASTVSANRIIDTALYPESPVKPRRKLIVVAGLILGLIFGIVYAFVKDFMDDKIKNEEDVKNRTDIPVLGTIPHFGKKSTDMVVFEKPKSISAEAFRNIRTNLLFMSLRPQGQIVTITSTIGGEGKSTIAQNLGGIISMAGKKVIILNLDMRKPTLHGKFGVSNKKGMSNLLSGHANLRDVIQNTDHENLDIIPSGPVPPNPSELIGGVILPETLRVLREHYDVIILDTPPIGLVTDAKLTMRMSDVTAYVMRAGQSRKGFLLAAEEIYEELGGKGMGIILNDFDVARHGYGYGYGYGSYGYGGYGYYKEEGV